MTEKLYEEYGNQIKSVALLSSSGGVFEVMVNGTLIYSKREQKRHTTFEEIRALIEAGTWRAD